MDWKIDNPNFKMPLITYSIFLQGDDMAELIAIKRQRLVIEERKAVALEQIAKALQERATSVNTSVLDCLSVSPIIKM